MWVDYEFCTCFKTGKTKIVIVSNSYNFFKGYLLENNKTNNNKDNEQYFFLHRQEQLESLKFDKIIIDGNSLYNKYIYELANEASQKLDDVVDGINYKTIY